MQAKFRIGEKVFVARRGENFDRSGEMGKYIGEFCFVHKILKFAGNYVYILRSSDGRIIEGSISGWKWQFDEHSLEPDGPYVLHHFIAREICGGNDG